MKIISHRGNVNGPSTHENEPWFVDRTIGMKFDVEIDLRRENGKLFLGHDKPQYAIDSAWIIERRKRLWIHCKNLESLDYIRYLDRKCNADLKYFFHQNDDCVLTSSKYFWTYPGKPICKNSILVLKAGAPAPKGCYGICTDYAFTIRNSLKKH